MKKSIPAFDIELINPVTRHVVTGFIFIVALMCCFLNDLPLYLQLFLSLLVVWQLLYGLSSKAFSHKGLSKVSCQHDAYWLLTCMDGKQQLATLMDSSVIIGPLYFLHFRTETGVLRLLISSDGMSRDSAITMRVALKVYRKALISARL